MDAFAFVLHIIGICIIIALAIWGHTTGAVIIIAFILLALTASGTRR